VARRQGCSKCLRTLLPFKTAKENEMWELKTIWDFIAMYLGGIATVGLIFFTISFFVGLCEKGIDKLHAKRAAQKQAIEERADDKRGSVAYEKLQKEV
jgi:hypothetical protein